MALLRLWNVVMHSSVGDDFEIIGGFGCKIEVSFLKM